MCNLRVNELVRHHAQFESAGVQIVAVFESSIEDMKPYVGAQQPPFVLLSDPAATIYDAYGVESSPERINYVIKHELAASRIAEAERAGFPLTPQEGSNFFRLPAEFLIDEHFNIVRSHYSNQIIDHMPLGEILNAASWQPTQ